MHIENMSNWTHDNVFNTGNETAERSTRVVMWITAITMVIEVAAGWWYNSMALLADGWHMSSHALAIGLSAMAYTTARRYVKDSRFTFGTWKIEILPGFASAILLVGIAAMMVIGSVERIISPQPIHYKEAILIAALGLSVNVVCAMILGKAHHHGHSHDHDHEHHDKRHDLNLKSAYLQVITDAATSVLAILALTGGWIYGWSWLDPVTGIVGAILVAIWAKGLIKETGKVLLDREMDDPLVDKIQDTVGSGDGYSQIADLHVWRASKNVYSCTETVVTHDETLPPDVVRERLSAHLEIGHSTIEINQCLNGRAGTVANMV